MNLQHFDIKREQAELDQAINDRHLLAERNIPPHNCIEMEQTVCVRSRALFSRYLDADLWSGVDEAQTKEVERSLRAAFEAIRYHKGSLESTRRRLAEFHNHVQNRAQRLAVAALDSCKKD